MMIGRVTLSNEEVSPNYRVHEVRKRGTGAVSWEVFDAATQRPVATGLHGRDEALRYVRGLERLNQRLEGGLEGHILPH
jgi:hypothetical protein